MNIADLYSMLASLYAKFNTETVAGKKLHDTAVSCLGVDMGDSGYGDDVDCAISLNNIVFRAFGDYAGGDMSTYRMYHALKNNKKFVQVSSPRPGDIIISPTGTGNGHLSNGHAGIVGYGDAIYSNDSRTGLFSSNYTHQSWKDRYVRRGGFPVLYFRRIFN